MVKAEERVEFVGQLMDVIEDVLHENGISFAKTASEMLAAGCSQDEVDDNDVVLYGETYDMFADPITKVLINWNVLEE